MIFREKKLHMQKYFEKTFFKIKQNKKI